MNVSDASCPVHWFGVLILWMWVLIYFFNRQKHLSRHKPLILSPLPETGVKCVLVETGGFCCQPDSQSNTAGAGAAPQHLSAFPSKALTNTGQSCSGWEGGTSSAGLTQLHLLAFGHRYEYSAMIRNQVKALLGWGTSVPQALGAEGN